MINRIAAFALIMLAAAAPSRAGEAESAVVEQWYAALSSIDRSAFGRIIDDNASIILEDLDIAQSKEEFLASLDDWAEATRGATILHRIAGTEGDLVTAYVCYRFPDNELYGRETFKVDGGKVVESDQMTLGEKCEGF